MSCPDHFHQFSGSDHGVNVVSRIFLIEQFHLTLALLGYTGHHGYRIDLLRLHPKLLGKIGLHHSPEHLLRRLGRRDLFQEMGNWVLANRIHPGQQEVNMGNSFSSPAVNRFRNSLASSIMVRSAENTVSNT